MKEIKKFIKIFILYIYMNENKIYFNCFLLVRFQNERTQFFFSLWLVFHCLCMRDCGYIIKKGALIGVIKALIKAVKTSLNDFK